MLPVVRLFPAGNVPFVINMETGMLIDIHTHASECTGFTRSNGSRYPTLAEYIDLLDAKGIDKAVLLCSVSPELRYVLVTPFEVLAMAAQHPDRIIPFCSVDPRMMANTIKADFRPMLRYFQDRGCKGIGEYLPNIDLDHPLNMNLFAQVEEIGLPLTFHLASTKDHQGQYGCYDDLGLPRLEKVLQAFPKLKLLAHSQVFWAEISADVTLENRSAYPKGPVQPGRAVELLRKYPNLYGDLSAGSGFNAIARDQAFGDAFLAEFADRLLFGTDIANVPQDTPLVAYFQKLRVEGRISPETAEKIAWKNANRLLGLGL